MKIATWNLDRPKLSSGKSSEIIEQLQIIDADILVLTETNRSIDLKPEYVGSESDELLPAKRCAYTKGENRTSIWSKAKYEKTREIPTWDRSSSLCVGLQTGFGELFVYGTVIGAFGHPNGELDRQIADWERIGQLGNICIAGDFNISWDSYYFTRVGRDKVSAALHRLRITNLTSQINENIDHIAISNTFTFLENRKREKPVSWNRERKRRKPRLSDHMGVSVDLEWVGPTSTAYKDDDKT